MKVVVKKVDCLGEVVEIEDKLEVYQGIVGGYIQTYPLGDNILIICDEEGKLKDYDVNIAVARSGYGMENICGDIIFVGEKDCDFVGLNDEQMVILREYGVVK